LTVKPKKKRGMTYSDDVAIAPGDLVSAGEEVGDGLERLP
jgi:hypothetical protein